MTRVRRWSRRSPVVLAIAAAVAACSSSAGSAGDARGDGPVDAKVCAQLEQDMAAAVAMPGTCASEADCSYFGGQLSGTQTCACAPYVLDCGGVPIENNAPGLAHAKVLAQQYVAGGCATAQACDCGPRGPMTCSVDHRCVAGPQSCHLAAENPAAVSSASR